MHALLSRLNLAIFGRFLFQTANDFLEAFVGTIVTRIASFALVFDCLETFGANFLLTFTTHANVVNCHFSRASDALLAKTLFAQ